MNREVFLFQKHLFRFFKLYLYQNTTKNTIKFMTDYSGKVFHLNDYSFVFKKNAVSGNEE